MPLQYRYDPDLKAVVTTVTGTLLEEDVLTHLRKMRDDSELPAGFIEIVDFSPADDFAVRVSAAGRIAFVVPELQERKNYQGPVFFARSELAFGMARVFQALREQLGIDTPIFSDWDELVESVARRIEDGRVP